MSEIRKITRKLNSLEHIKQQLFEGKKLLISLGIYKVDEHLRLLLHP